MYESLKVREIGDQLHTVLSYLDSYVERRNEYLSWVFTFWQSWLGFGGIKYTAAKLFET